MNLSGVLLLLLATPRYAAVAAATDTIGPNSLRGGVEWGGGSSGEEDETPALPEDERLPAGSECCNCIHVLDGFACAERGTICARCETFATGEGEHTEESGQSTGVVDGNIYYPLEGDGPWPVVSFGHGKGNNGVKTDRTRRNLLLFMVEMGFVVVAHREVHNWPAANYAAQLEALDWLYESEFAALVDRSTTLLMGHSMGGRGTLTNVADPATLEKYNVKAAIAMHPWCIGRCQAGLSDCGIPLVPTLWVTGNNDWVASPDSAYTHYVAQVLSDKVFIERDGMGHNYPDNFLYDNDSSMEKTFKNFVQCEVFDQETACVALFGNEDLSDRLGEDGDGVDLAIERDDDPSGFFQPWRGPEYFPEGGNNWIDPSDGYSRTMGYRLTTGPKTCTDARDCLGRNPWCAAECRNPVFCGKPNSLGVSNCELCRDEPDYPDWTSASEDVAGGDLYDGMFEEVHEGAIKV